MPEYEEAAEVREIAQKLINSCHSHLVNAKIKYLYRDPAPRSKGKIVMGRATKVSGKYKAVSGYDFIIEISKIHFVNMDQEKKLALVDHELSHCWMEDGKCTTIAHDFEGFNSVLKRHGFWAGDLEVMGKTAKQLELPFDNEKPDLQVMG
ncbi:MAG: putative metallopeptidase [Bacteroidota bacterium]